MRKDTKLDKFFRWMTNVEYKFNKTKAEWRNRSAASKILHLVLVWVFMLAAWGILYFAVGLFSKTSSGGIAEVVWSLLIFFTIILLIIVDVPIITYNYKDLIINAIVAFTCRPPKKAKNIAPNEGENAEAEQTTEIVEVSKTSRGFDTVIGWLSILQVVIFTVGLVAAVVLALNIAGKKIS